MRASLLPVAFFAVALVPPSEARAQMLTSPGPVYVLSGCGPASCHVFRMFHIPGVDAPLGHEIWQFSYLLNYRRAGLAFQIGWEGVDGTWNDIIAPYINHYVKRYEEGPRWLVTPVGWRPTSMRIMEFYGPLEQPLDIVDEYGFIDLHVTPEPASLLLIGTGLAGIAGAAARRRRRNT